MGEPACSAAEWAAVEELRRQLAARPDDARLHFQLGERLQSIGDGGAAIASFRRAAELAPRVAAAQFGLANAYYAAERYDAAVDAFLAAQRLENDAPTATNLGTALAQLGRLDEAAAAFAEALRLKPDYVPALVNAGRTSLAQKDFAAAASSFEQAVAQLPDRSELRIWLGDAYAESGRIEAAAVEYVRAATLRPDDAALFHRLGDVNRRRGQLTEAQFCYAKALELEPRSAPTHSALVDSMLCDAGTSAEQILQEARYWSSCHAAKDAPLPTDRSADANRPLRVGYVLCDEGEGALGALLAEVFKHHRRDAFEPQRYSLLDDEWATITPTAFAERVRNDKIDVLVDLAGHRRGNRLQAFALRAAPLQVAWLAYPGTTGLSAIDYLLADRELVRHGEEAFFAEQIMQLEEGYVAYAPPSTNFDTGPSPFERNGGITFGAFGELVKITPSVVQLWSTILQSDPSFTLFLQSPDLDDPAVQDRTAAQFAEHLIERKQLRFAGAVTREQRLEAYRDVDIALDTFPYDGGVELLDALWMGVPVVHLCGQRFSGRRGDVLLRAAGLAEFLAESREEYLQKALTWAADRKGLEALRGRLRSQLAASSLCDVPALVRGLESAYRSLWHKRCESFTASDPC